MRNLKQFVSDAPKPLLIQVGIIVLLVLPPLWWIQQNNVDALNQQISALKQQIDTLPSSIPIKDRLVLEKDRLSLEKDRAILQNGVYLTLVQAVGAAFFFVTAYLTWRNVKATESNVRATEEKQVTERFSKAIEHLSNEKLEVRLGGIYALERIAKDSPKDYWTVMEILAAFIRERPNEIAARKPLPPEGDMYSDADETEYLAYFHNREFAYPEKLPTDIQAVLTIFNRRSHSYLHGEEQRLDLNDVDFRWLVLPQTVHFRGMSLVLAKFTHSRLSDVDLTGTDLSKADFYCAQLCRTILKNANLESASLTDAFLKEAIFEQANLDGARLHGANLVQANLKNASLKKADLRKAKLTGCDLRGADLSTTRFHDRPRRGLNLKDLKDLSANVTPSWDCPSKAEVELIGAQISEALIDENTKLPDYLVFKPE